MIITSRNFCLAILMLLLAACTKMHLDVSGPVVIPEQARIVVGPLANHSDTPLANRQVESMSVGLLQSDGFTNVNPYPRRQSCEKLLYCADEGMPNAQLIAWARKHHVAFVLTGATNEWRYKVGLDGEPVAGVSLSLIDVRTGRTIWSGVGSIIGGSRLGLDVVGQRMLDALFSSIAAG